ncbi:TolC family outer membrane protein, partial [Porticoccaceae bacterium]|nr:TolC family outer membrane protein [Porticoccaceae bacterium]
MALRNPLSAALLSITLTSAGFAHSADLEEIFRQALSNDPILNAAQATYLAGREVKTQSRAALLPQLSAAGSYGRSEDETSTIVVEGSSTNAATESESSSWGASLNQAVFNLPAWYQFKRGSALSEAAKAQFTAAQQSMIVRVAEDYFNALRAADNLETRRAEQRAIGRQLDQTQERYDVGLIAITDVHEAQAAFDDARVNTLEAESALVIAFEQFEVLTGSRYELLAGLASNFSANAPTETAEAWVNFALANNPQLQSAALLRDAARAGASAGRAGHLPLVSMSLSYNDGKTDRDYQQINRINDALLNAIDSQLDNETTTLAVSVSMPLFTSGLVSSQRRQSVQESVRSSEDYTLARRNTVKNARSSFQLVTTNAARVSARRQAVVSAQSALDATQAGYEVGTRNIVDVLFAQRTLFQAQRNFANARYDYILSHLRLKQVAGQLSPDDIYQLNSWLSPQQIVNN